MKPARSRRATTARPPCHNRPRRPTTTATGTSTHNGPSRRMAGEWRWTGWWKQGPKHVKRRVLGHWYVFFLFSFNYINTKYIISTTIEDEASAVMTSDNSATSVSQPPTTTNDNCHWHKHSRRLEDGWWMTQNWVMEARPKTHQTMCFGPLVCFFFVFIQIY